MRLGPQQGDQLHGTRPDGGLPAGQVQCRLGCQAPVDPALLHALLRGWYRTPAGFAPPLKECVASLGLCCHVYQLCCICVVLHVPQFSPCLLKHQYTPNSVGTDLFLLHYNSRVKNFTPDQFASQLERKQSNCNLWFTVFFVCFFVVSCAFVFCRGQFVLPHIKAFIELIS